MRAYNTENVRVKIDQKLWPFCDNFSLVFRHYFGCVRFFAKVWTLFAFVSIEFGNSVENLAKSEN